jgi:hypothetical protein
MSIRLFLLLLVVADTCCAGLRETSDELIARYGSPRLTTSGKEAGEPSADQVLAFVVLSTQGGGRHVAILAYMSGGKCEAIRYNPNDYDRLSESEIEEFKQENGGGLKWMRKEEETSPEGVNQVFITNTPDINKGSILELLKNRLIAYFATASFVANQRRPK